MYNLLRLKVLLVLFLCIGQYLLGQMLL